MKNEWWLHIMPKRGIATFNTPVDMNDHHGHGQDLPFFVVNFIFTGYLQYNIYSCHQQQPQQSILVSILSSGTDQMKCCVSYFLDSSSGTSQSFALRPCISNDDFFGN
jgi:hypothetical protein